MSDSHISVHVKDADQDAVKSTVKDIFTSAGYGLLNEESAQQAVESEDELEEDIYGFVLSGATQGGWISVYVDDWVDSGLIAKTVSEKLQAWVLETWIQDEFHWGYTLYSNGQVVDRFTDDPYALTDDPNEAALYTGDQEKFLPILEQPAETLKLLLDEGQERAAEENSVRSIALLAETVGIQFEHALMGLEDFFDIDPEDYVIDLEDWPSFRFLTFRHPEGRTALSPDTVP